MGLDPVFEILVILVVALLVVGPDKLRICASSAKWCATEKIDFELHGRSDQIPDMKTISMI